MAEGHRARRQLSHGVSALTGVALGTVVVLLFVLVLPPLFAVSLGLPRSGSVPSLGCGAGQCDNITISFQGAASLSPGIIRLSITPTNSSVVVNGSVGQPLNLTFVSGSSPHWVGSFAGGTTSPTPFAAEIVNPSGQLVVGGSSTIVSGATLCLKGTLSTTEEFELKLEYQGTTAHVLFAVS